MTAKKKRKQQPWRKTARLLRRIGIVALLLLLGGLGVWFVVRGGDKGEPVYWMEGAKPFALPTIDGGETTLAEHRGQHNVLLYFNEGMG